MKTISLALHGGAGTISRSHMSPEKETAYRATLQLALNTGYGMLENGSSALDAVEATVKVLEDSPLFNAGKGAVFTNTGTHEMDASIMNGSNLEAGAVAGVSGVKNPISLSRMVMENSEHVLLVGAGAEEFAKTQKVDFEKEAYFYDELRFHQLQEAKKNNVTQLDHSPLNEKKYGTVGAVACDAHGNLAAATSTGGMTNKKFGRVGDSPIIGSGNYANNNTCAVSCTGSGEFFLRAVVAYDVSCLMEYKGLSLEDACNEVVHNRLMKINGDGGLVAVDARGNVSLPFNTDGMYRAAKSSSGLEFVEIYK
tara:strand:- start:351 stop:1280 length:930 start_codon:yes stop_codon:yes gene_type:complete